MKLLELLIILLLGNLASLLGWWWQLPVGSGLVAIALSGAIYGYVIWRSGQPGYTVPRLNLAWWKLGIAISTGVVLTLPPIIFFLFPVVVGRLDYTPITALSIGGLVARLGLEIPLLTALSEELLFRHYLWERFKATRLLATLVYNSLIFTLWHLVVVMRTVLDTSLSQNIWLVITAYLGGLLSIALGGVVFGLVRHRAGSFWYSALTHWLNVALMTLTIWLF